MCLIHFYILRFLGQLIVVSFLDSLYIPHSFCFSVFFTDDRNLAFLGWVDKQAGHWKSVITDLEAFS